MTRAGKRYHQKRVSSPKIWPVTRKGTKFLPKISPGPHSKEYSMPLLILLRDNLKLGQSRKEIKRILSSRSVLIDGKIRTNDKFPVGHMDIVELPSLKKAYRIQIHTSNKLRAIEIPLKDKTSKVCKVVGKRTIKGGDFQISLHDGRNIVVGKRTKHAKEISTQSSIRITLPGQTIKDVFPLEENVRAMVTEGRHQGKIGTIMEIDRRYGPKASEVIFQDDDNKELSRFRTALDYVFVLGPSLQLDRGDVNEQ
ncbi:MAG: 30S ribosomal protein S4e [Candidatus Heimdallarchaeota archaeon]|nr:30S ribosomal protein S4e [Candidatus Heimdallarchaeota archaeon]MDH5646219.1 30S ribosomal protein S4e [Candidatus Heimdallarchaeota archaeon]